MGAISDHNLWSWCCLGHSVKLNGTVLTGGPLALQDYFFLVS